MRKSILPLLAAACVVLIGCFTRDEPFYEESQIVQFPQLPGSYRNIGMTTEGRDDGSKWLVTPSLDIPGKYEVIIQESDVTVKLLGTLFRIQTNLFFDLYPLTDSGVYHVGGGVSVTEMLRSAMYRPLHVVWKVELSDDGLSYSFPYGNGVVAALRKAPELKGEPAESPGRILLPSGSEAQKYLLKFKDDPSVFNYKGRLMKKKADAQPNGPADGSQPFSAGTNPISGAAGSRR